MSFAFTLFDLTFFFKKNSCYFIISLMDGGSVFPGKLQRIKETNLSLKTTTKIIGLNKLKL